MLTFGTGIGSALFVDGHLVPNTEFGHIQVDGEDGERRASAAAREREDLDYPELGEAGRPLPRRPRGRAVARPDHRRRRGEQEGAQVGAAAHHPDAGRARRSCRTTPASSARPWRRTRTCEPA